MEITVILVSFIASLLTFFSGFGLGTLMLPVFALWFPPQLAIAMTAIVHLANNLFKFLLMFRHIDKPLLMRFGALAVVGALIGAGLLSLISGKSAVITEWHIGDSQFTITSLNFTIGFLILIFLIVDFLGLKKRMKIPPQWLPAGGLLSGFFGGLSGHQGALRSLFLINAGVSKEVFVATGVCLAVLVDITRITVYSGSFEWAVLEPNLPLLGMAIGSAFVAALIGRQLLTKMTLDWLHSTVSFFILLVACAMMVGVI